MLDLQAFATRISTPDLTAQLAVSVDTAQQTRKLPSMVVVPGRDKVITQPLSQGAGARHRVAVEIMVVTGVQRGNEVLGEAMKDQLKALREPMLRQLINWLPDGADVEVHWQGGQLLSLTNNALFWVDAFKTEYWWTL